MSSNIETNTSHLILLRAICDGASAFDLRVILKYGGADVVMPKGYKGKSTLMIAYSNRHLWHYDLEFMSTMIDIGGRNLVMLQDDNNNTALHYAFRYWYRVPSKIMSKIVEVTMKIIELGGKELVMCRGSNNCTALFLALKNAPVEVITRLIEVGGKELLMLKSKYDTTALYHAIRNHRNVSMEVIVKMIDVGGKDLLMQQNDTDKLSALLYGIWYEAPEELLMKLIEVGGREMVLLPNMRNSTSLNWSFVCEAPQTVILNIINVGGKDILMLQHNVTKATAMHYACEFNASVEALQQMIEVGGSDMLKVKDIDGKNAIQAGLISGLNTNSCIFMIKQGIAADVGGEYGCGGVFSFTELPDQVQASIYEHWNRTVLPVLTSVMSSMKNSNFPPLLQAAIKAKAPRNVIIDIIDRFDCIMTRDSSNFLPINIAVNQRLDWESGMKEVIESTATKQQRAKLYVAAYYGLQWTNHMRELIESKIEANTDKLVDECDSETETGLHNIIVISSMGDHTDLETIYNLLKRSPDVMVSYSDIRSSKRRRITK